MSLLNNITEDWKVALKNKLEVEKTLLSSLKATILNKEKEIKTEVSDLEILAIIQKEINKRKDSFTAYVAGKRQDLADVEAAEIKILEGYLPTQLSIDEIRSEVKSVIIELETISIKQMGQVMKTVLAKLAGKADLKTVSQVIKEELS